MKTTYTIIDLDNFDPKSFFKSEGYPFFEEFDESKTYSNLSFEFDYGQGLRTYKFSQYSISDKNNVKKRLSFIISEEQLNEKELEELSKYCQCQYHIKKWYNPMKYFTCKCCHGCLESCFPEQFVINDTRKFIRENNIISSMNTRMFNGESLSFVGSTYISC